MGVLSVIGVIFFVMAEVLVGLFTQDPLVMEEGVRCLRIAALAQPLMAWTDVHAGALRGAGDTRSPMVVALVGPVLVRVVACWLLAYEMGLGLAGIWIGSTLDWGVRSIWLSLVFRRGKWQHVNVS